MGRPRMAVSSWLRALSGLRLLARVSFWVIAACAFWMACGTASAQISPGPLAMAHRDLNGSSNCVKCHEVSTKSVTFRCMECHREIAAEVQQHRGLHSTYPQSGPTGSACIKCHSDHNGENFAMLHWTPTAAGFDHSKTG